MNNTYIFEIDQFTDEDAQNGKDLDETDRVVFLPNDNGMIPYMLIPEFLSWKVIPTFMEPVEEPMNDTVMAFLLGLQSAGCNGNLNICMKNNPFSALDESSFETESGVVTVHCCSSMGDALSKRSDTKDKKAAAKEQSLFVRESDQEPEIGKKPDNTYPDASSGFMRAIKGIQGETELNLIKHVNALSECVRESPEGMLPSLKFQVGMRFFDEYVTEITDLICDHFDELREAL